MGYLLPAQHGLKMSATIKPSLTESTEAIRHLSIYERNCYFADEKKLGISKSYTEKSCLIECRLQYLNEVCGCRPYYFNMRGRLLMLYKYLLFHLNIFYYF